jgi:effector-binding domain-containing protein
MQMTEPTIQERQEQSYVAISRRVSMDELGSTIPPLLGDVFGWIAKQGLTQAGPPFFRYVVLNMPGDMVVAAGVPIAEPVAGEDEIEAGTVPAGRYVTAVHTGHPDELEAATGQLLAWADAHDVTWPMHREADGEHWDARYEFYLDSPDEQPDMTKWRTQLAFLTA